MSQEQQPTLEDKQRMLDKVMPKAVLKALAPEAGPNCALGEAEMHFEKGRRCDGSTGRCSRFGCRPGRPSAEPVRPSRH
jgi:hypothetical protein